MTAGLPGTGVSGFFYFILVGFMPFLELYQMTRGKSSLARWRVIGFHWFVTFCIFGVVGIEYYLAMLGLGWLQSTRTFVGNFLDWCTGGREIIVQFHPFGLIISLLVLSGVIGLTFLVSVAQRWGLIGQAVAVSPAAAQGRAGAGA